MLRIRHYAAPDRHMHQEQQLSAAVAGAKGVVVISVNMCNTK